MSDDTETTETPEASPEAAAAPEPAAPPQTPKERRQAKRARQVAKRGTTAPQTLEERLAAREQERKRKAAQRRRNRSKAREKRAAAPTAAAEPTPPTAEHGPGRPKQLQGIVVSDKADKTIVVRVDEARSHPRYRKVMRSSIKVHAHDAANDANAGDTVRVIESRPLSATKRWRLVEVVERAR